MPPNPKIPHPIQYQGSKRNLAPMILRYFPENVETLIEPFAGYGGDEYCGGLSRRGGLC